MPCRTDLIVCVSDVDQVVLDLGKKSYFAFVEEAILVLGRDFSVFFIGNVCLGDSFSSI